MRFERRPVVAAVLLAVVTLVAASPLAAQDFRGRINGVVTDNTGAVLPGVTVTATSPALIQPQLQVTRDDGSYRFIALPPGVYTLAFELPGFTTLRREGIRVVINQTLPVDAQLQVATLQETVTVTGESPVVDTSTTTVGTNFTKELLTEIPNARDIWAAMAQAPGLQMTAHDVGGSRTGTQTGFLTYGFGDQHQTKLEGIDTTEGTAANAGYFDFGSFEEFQIGGAGSSAENFGGGASMSITVKSGADRFTGSFYSDWEGDSTISDNVPDAFRTANNRDGDGYFVRTALQRGNPIDRQYDINFNVGGPLWKGKAWGFYSYRLNDQYKYSIGIDTLARSKLSNAYTFKGTFQLTQNNQVVGFLNKREKLQELRDLGPTTPISAARYQSSRNYPWKWQWTSVLGSRAFLDVLAGNWYNFFPLRPTAEAGLDPEPMRPGRIDLTDNQRTGVNNAYQDQKRFKPQFYISLAYFQDGWRGSHDFKFGFDWKRDRRKFFRDQPFDLFYRDRNGQPSEIDLYNTAAESINDVEYNAGWVQDNWKISPRLTLNLGLRMEHYVDGWPDQAFTPNGHPMLAGWDDPVYQAFVAQRAVEATEVSRTFTLSPRAGFAYDLTGDNRTVLKGFYGRYYFNSADDVADGENPVGVAQLRYRFLDPNGNTVLDGPQELGNLITTVGNAGTLPVDRSLERPYSQQFSGHLEREIREGLSGRASFIHNQVRNEWDEVDVLRKDAYTIPFVFTDIGPDGVRGTGDDAQVNLVTRPASAPSQRLFTNPADPSNDADFYTVEFAANRRMRGNWMLLTSFAYTWLDQFHADNSSTSALGTAANEREHNWQPNMRMFGDRGREVSTLWNYKAIGQYLLPYGIGLSGSWKVQSGRNWGRVTSVALPGGAGSESIRLEPVDANRAPTVSIVDVRAAKKFIIKGVKLEGMVDIFNALNAGTVVNFRTTTGATFKEVLAILDPRIVRFGVRVDF
jgi:hypothetical protein